MTTSQNTVARDPSLIPTDTAALRALAQAAINVELFTIPLYMAGMYSIQGMHEINAAKQTFYKGRRWPGAATTHAPGTANEKAFNILFSVFIQEMLHLQLAANLATGMGVKPDFTSRTLQTPRYGWTCYGPTLSTIPHIIDLRDTTTYENIKVQIGALDKNLIELFLAIEEPENAARERIKPSALSKYFPAVPFKDWTPNKTESDLPLFGTIGYMYECMVQYMQLRYSDGTTLWERVYTPSGVQRDLFNTSSPGHTMAEYPGFAAMLPKGTQAEALHAAINMINAITDQGEGRTVGVKLRAMLKSEGLEGLEVVAPNYRSSEPALKADYPSYDANGNLAPSRDASARYGNDASDHYERFSKIKTELLGKIVTWPKWHADRGGAPWKPADLLTGTAVDPSSKIPPAADVAAALNRLKARNRDGSVHTQFSQIAAGAIAGITRVLNDYWSGKVSQFPFPSMSGSGDRMAMCWATLGQAPDLSLGIEEAKPGTLYHACQGLSLDQPGKGGMPSISTYHTCRGSNACKGQGGCGFVQSVNGGGSCGTSLKAQVLCGGGDTLYSAPSDNRCGGFGGCAVPIAAAQLFPNSGKMQVFDIHANTESTPIGTLPFEKGAPVYDVAWDAYCMVLQYRQQTPPQKPSQPDDLRLAFPPST
ncbi:ferritin-like domain-containing protein [Myxococcus sp. Y35]|uniref:ferritin-like domain-containing protein n=1 Tax=Pseudomyxococcus flavus TaxID=3115648 RepID=UPI003CEAD58B